jgi:hypothetical protein
MQTRKILVNVAALTAMAVGSYFLGHRGYNDVFDKLVESQKQEQTLSDKVLPLKEGLNTATEKLAKKDREYNQLSDEKEALDRKYRILYDSSKTYPNDTPRDVIRANKKLESAILQDGCIAVTGHKIILELRDEVNRVIPENLRLDKENRAWQAYGDTQGLYYDRFSGKIVDPTRKPLSVDASRSPLGIEKLEHEKTKEDLKYERAQRDIREGVITGLRSEIELAKHQKEQWRNYSKDLEDYYQNPRVKDTGQRSGQDSR